MSIPFYFAMEENEAGLPPDMRCAQLGFGFHEDGTLRLPKRFLPDSPAVINDRFLPSKAPEPSVLDRLASACGNGCFLDFERPVNEISAAIAVGLQQRLRGKLTVPPKLQGLCPDADVQIPGVLCNHWERFMENVQSRRGDRWVLEIIPWYVSLQSAETCDENGILQEALCGYRFEGGSVIYFDTEETIRKKLAVAEKHGCRGGITLLREYRQMIKMSA